MGSSSQLRFESCDNTDTFFSSCNPANSIAYYGLFILDNILFGIGAVPLCNWNIFHRWYCIPKVCISSSWIPFYVICGWACNWIWTGWSLSYCICWSMTYYPLGTNWSRMGWSMVALLHPCWSCTGDFICPPFDVSPAVARHSLGAGGKEKRNGLNLHKQVHWWEVSSCSTQNFSNTYDKTISQCKLCFYNPWSVCNIFSADGMVSFGPKYMESV